MDPLSQACLGASLSQSATNNRQLQLPAFVVGSLAGMAPDLDVLIRSSTDPLLFLEYHRQFTHSLIFIPFGALLCALFFYPFVKNRISFFQNYLFSFLGLATHGLLDACTSYGTQLYWPFSNERVAWNIVSIIDPFFTIPVLVLVVVAVIKKKLLLAKIAFIYSVLFLSLGLIQKNRAEDALLTLVTQRGHTAERILVKPSFANRHVWKLIYEYNNTYYVDAVKLLWQPTLYTGTSIKKLELKDDLPLLDNNSQQAIDIERFRWFSNNYLAMDPSQKNRIIDVRYSFIPNQVRMMWGIQLNKPNEHVSFIINSRPTKKERRTFLEILF